MGCAERLLLRQLCLLELLNFPFYLADPEILTQQVDRPMPENGEEWTTLEDAFPNSYPTHTKFQKYDFDVGYRLMRIHYIVDVLKRPAPAWHNCFNHAIAGKLLYPTLRLVTSSLPDMAFFFFPVCLERHCVIRQLSTHGGPVSLKLLGKGGRNNGD
jgi:hypothetical protein